MSFVLLDSNRPLSFFDANQIVKCQPLSENVIDVFISYE